MSIKLGQITYDIKNSTIDCDPIRIGVTETFGTSAKENVYGKNIFNKMNSRRITKLEFDALTENEVVDIRSIMQNRQYENKIFVNEPSTNQILSTDSMAAGYSQIDTAPGANWSTTIGSTDIAKMRYIDANYYSITNATTNFTYLYFQFDLNPFILAYGVNAIQYLTLFLHNPYCFEDNGSIYAKGYRILAYSDKWSKYYQIGEQSYSINDYRLRVANKMNQQFYTIKKVSEFTDIGDSLYSARYVRFVMVNKEPRINQVELGVNSVGLLINGLGVKQTNPDNFTYRNEWTGSGYTGSIELTSI